MEFVIETQNGHSAPSPKTTTPKATAADLAPDDLKNAVFQSIDGDKGEDIIVVDLHDKSNIADFVVIASGRSSRQIAAMADHLVERLQPGLSFRIAIEGLPQGDWVLIDCGDVIVHLFRPEVRDFYAIEKMWGLEPPKMPVSDTPFGELPGAEPESLASF